MHVLISGAGVAGPTLAWFLANDERSVRVGASDGAVGEYDLVVAADGQWSKVRQLCFGEAREEGTGANKSSSRPSAVNIVDYNIRVAYWTIPRLPQDDDWCNFYAALPAKVVAIRPNPHGTIRAIVTCLPTTDAQKKEWAAVTRRGRQAQEALVRKEFTGCGWQAERLLAVMPSAPDFYLQLVQQIKMPQWYKSRVDCLGDAGYDPSPITGMGTSMAINGAYLLVGELRKLGPDENHPLKALEAYDRAHRPFVEEYQQVPPVFPDYVYPRTAFQR